MSSCSFGKSIGGGSIICGTNIKISSLVTIPLSECTKSVSTHLSYCHINHETIASEAELLLVRGGLYSSDISSLTVCPNHRHKLGNGWSCGKTCSLCSSKKSMPKGTITKDQSKYLFMTKDRYVGIGSEEGMKVWKQYGIGCGQFIPYLLCFDEGNSQIAELKMLENFNSPIRNKTITQRPEGPSTNDDTNVSDDQPAPNVDGDTDNGLFSCPEPNCIRSFSKYGNLMHHLDVGNHSFMKKGLSLSDRSIINYATKIESKVASNPQMESSSLVPNPTSLTKGWALKNKREIKRFSENQKQFLQSKFDMGERSGLKCDPEDVSNEMRAVRNKDGTRIFSIDDFLSASQIASYFSRLCLLKRKRSLEVLEEEDFEAAEFENNFQDLNSLAKQ